MKDIKLVNQTLILSLKTQLWMLKSTKDQMASFGFPSTKQQKKEYFGNKGILMTYLNVMGKMFATAENPALKNYSKVVTTKYLP